jgi:LmbE family N-acetylglucosaminyl deacetylase
MNNLNGKVIVFAPHPDDETLGCGGTIAKKIREGYEVTVVVMTDGRHALSAVFGIDSDPTPQQLKHIRKEEVRRAVAILGVPEKNLIFLDFEDGSLWQNKEEAEKTVEQILEKDLAGEIFLPYEKDYNIDHKAANKMVLDAAREVNSSASRYKYSITQKYSRAGPILDELLNVFKHNLVAVDISEFLSLKEAAVREFRSQITIVSNKQKKPVLSETGRFLRNKEVFHVE